MRPVAQRRNENCTGLAQIVGQVQASDRDFQSKFWANMQNLAQPCEFLVQRALRPAGRAPGCAATSSCSRCARCTPRGTRGPAGGWQHCDPLPARRVAPSSRCWSSQRAPRPWCRWPAPRPSPTRCASVSAWLLVLETSTVGCSERPTTPVYHS
jgi:hypothetical protein